MVAVPAMEGVGLATDAGVLSLLPGGFMRVSMRVIGWSLAVIGAGAVALVAQSSLLSFGVHVDRIKPSMVDTFTDGIIPAYPNAKAYHTASVAARVAFVKEAFNWAKAYSETAAFKADYEKHRENAKPAAAEDKGSPDDQYKKMIADQQKQIDEMKKSMKTMSPDMQKAMQQVVDQLEEGMKKTANDPQAAAMMKQSFAASAANDQEQAHKDVADYEQHYPADPKVSIARRLHAFLDESKNVNYSAQLTADGGGGKMRFADPQYEQKSDRWKMYYRAGREPMEAARAAATEWLKQIEGK
jgi:hypothetical protein